MEMLFVRTDFKIAPPIIIFAALSVSLSFAALYIARNKRRGLRGVVQNFSQGISAAYCSNYFFFLINFL